MEKSAPPGKKYDETFHRSLHPSYCRSYYYLQDEIDFRKKGCPQHDSNYYPVHHDMKRLLPVHDRNRAIDHNPLFWTGMRQSIFFNRRVYSLQCPVCEP